MSASRQVKDDVIQIRASSDIKALLVRVAALRGQKLSEFMLESARKHAENTLLDQRTFFLDAEAHARFLKQLDKPPLISVRANTMFNRKAPWKK